LTRGGSPAGVLAEGLRIQNQLVKKCYTGSYDVHTKFKEYASLDSEIGGRTFKWT